jgi:hypothetical protein
MLVMVGGVQVVPVRHFGMVCGLFVIASLVVLGRFMMVLGRVLMVVGGLLMVFMDVVAVHRSLPVCSVAKPEHCRGSMKYLRRSFVRSSQRNRSRRPATAGSELG